mmetsp:Transcript_40041/g.58504  ORF Transcript_40041/g.58504 Transcript_40041/m.58504 type:complete len:350 (+) Transcript_40041:66-1115(+)
MSKSKRQRQTLLAVLSTVVTVTVAQPSFSILYENYVKIEDYNLPLPPNTNDAEVQTIIRTQDFDQCFQCARRDSCYWGKCEIPIPSSVYWTEWLWEGLLLFAATLEVLFRGFTMGFGVRMLKYLFLEPPGEAATTTRASIVKSYRRKALVSAISGLSLAFFLYGSSIFFPASLRDAWFAYDRQSWRQGTAAKQLPPAIYKFLRQSLTDRFRKVLKYHYYDCPLVCSVDDFELQINWTEYGLGRIGSGLVYLTTTLEVLLRAFFLGFGARMLKFLFFPNDRDDPGSVEESSRVPDDDDNEQEKEEEEDDLFQSFQHRAVVSALSGISVAAVVHGLSLFVPTELREKWFEF